MKEKMVEQINAELTQSVRTDKTVIKVTLILNIILLFTNSSVAAAAISPKADLTIKLILLVLTAFVVVLNIGVGYALSMGKKRRVKSMESLTKFYEDEGLGKYQDASLSSGYVTRYNLFTIITLALGAVALLIPSIIFFVR